MTVRALLIIAAAATACAAAEAPAARREALKEAQQLLRAGSYRAAVPRLMDLVAADPSDADARAALDRAASLAAADELRAAAYEKEELLAGAENDMRRLETMRRACARRLEAWRRALSRVCSLAGDPDTVRDAVNAYEKLLASAPVYTYDREELAAACAKVKDVFYRTIKKEYPYLVEGREHADERDIASLMFARASTQDDYGRYNDTGATQNVLDKADRLRSLERAAFQQQANLVKAVDLYGRRRYSESSELLEDVLAFDHSNEEALFYWGLSRSKIRVPEDGAAEKGE